jgi:7-cyano-7-deazaguanine synthase
MTDDDKGGRSALVLFSGGQDSATCLAWALDRFDRVETIGFDYGQRHRVELDCRVSVLDSMRAINAAWSSRLKDDHLIAVESLGRISETALTRDEEIRLGEEGLPTTFVPGRNLMFFTLAAAIAYRRGIRHLVGGMCETDFSGYPDCRDDTIKALQVVLNLGMNRKFVLHTPLMWLDKSAAWHLAARLGGNKLVQSIIENTHTCYYGDRSERHEWGYGCGKCPACELRGSGYRRFVAELEK